MTVMQTTPRRSWTQRLRMRQSEADFGRGQGSTVFPRVERAEVDASGRVTHHAPKRGSGNRVNEPCRCNTGQVGRTIVLNITRFPDIFGAQPTPGAGGDALTPP